MGDDSVPAWWDLGYRWFCVRLWFRERPAKVAWWLAFKLPRRVALFAFVRVYAESGDSPGPEYSRAYQAWERGGLVDAVE